MHDIDRTQLEHDVGRTQLEGEKARGNGHGGLEEIGETGEFNEFGEVGEFGEFGEFGELGETGEYGEFGEGPAPGFESEEAECPLTEAQEMELTSAFLEISTEQELEQFLGDVFRTVGQTYGRFARSGTGRALGGILRGAAKQALPVVGRAIGQYVSPGRGGDVGARLATQAGRIFGLELEGLSQEDKEFEIARQFVRFASTAAKQASLAPPNAPPGAIARSAAANAARAYAPGFLSRLRGRSGLVWPRSGRWIRRGRTIVLYGG